MGIRVTCPNCGKQLNVKSFLAGKRGVCPDCRGKFDIPGGRNVTLEVDDGDDGTEVSTVAAPSLPDMPAPAAVEPAPAMPPPAAASPWPASIPSPAMPYAAQPAITPTPPYSPVPAATGGAMPAHVAQPMYHAPAPADPITEAPQAQWYVRPPVGGQFGPAVGDVMRQWIQERRVTPDSLVWREGWSDWQRADIVFPTLAVVPQVTAAPQLPGVPQMAVPMMTPFPGTHSPAPQEADVGNTMYFNQDAVRAASSRIPKKRSRNTTTIWLVILIVALLVLAPLFGYVLMQQMK